MNITKLILEPHYTKGLLETLIFINPNPIQKSNKLFVIHWGQWEKEKRGLDKERSKCDTVHYSSLPPGKKCSEVWGAPTVASKLYKIS